jgi:hypothetical protein
LHSSSSSSSEALHLSNFIRSAVSLAASAVENLYRLALCLYSCYFCVSLPFSVFVSAGFFGGVSVCCERAGVLCVVSCGVERKPKKEEEEEPWRRSTQSWTLSRSLQRTVCVL